jgi:hypothetical protein
MFQPHPAQKNLRQVYCIRTARAEEAQTNCECFSDLLNPTAHLKLSQVGWVVGWLNMLGQVAGISSTEFGLANMIWAAVVIAKDGNYEVTSGKVVGLFSGLLIFHGILVRLGHGCNGTMSLMTSVLKHRSWVSQNCLATRHLAAFTKGFVFINLGTTVST